jgi:hypothetical protein
VHWSGFVPRAAYSGVRGDRCGAIASCVA